MRHSVELTEDDLKQAVQMYVRATLDMDAANVHFTHTPGSTDPREPYGGYVTCSAELLRPAQGKD